MEKIVNAKGLACPLPVVETKKATENMAVGDKVSVYVDNKIAVENLIKFAKSRNYEVESKTISDKEYEVIMEITEKDKTEEGREFECEIYNDSSVSKNQVVVLSSETMGTGDDKLGRNLMKAFIFSLTQQDNLPDTILCYNGGVKLASNGSESLEDLAGLSRAGVRILSCGTCLDFYGLREELAVGTVTNMYEIVEILEQAGSIIRP